MAEFEGMSDEDFEELDDDWEEDLWEPSCQMDCELCGCHGDCEDCDVPYEDDEDSEESP